MSDKLFTKDEKKLIKKTLELVTKELRSIYNESSCKKIQYEMNIIENDKLNTYTLNIIAKEMYLYLNNSGWYMELDKIGLNQKYSNTKITDYNLAFEFLKKYDIVKKGVLEQATQNVIDKKNGITKIENLYASHLKEATIEIEAPETLNKPTIEITKEDGKNISCIQVGPVSLKIFASENVNLLARETVQKVKKK